MDPRAPTQRCMHPPSDGGCLVIEIDHDGALTWVTLAGELGACASSRLRDTLTDLSGDVIVDCERLSFLDSAGTAVLIDAACSLAADDYLLTLVRVHAGPRRILDIMDLTEMFGIEAPPSLKSRGHR